jgi:3-(3-hydroxy-phenyl)propionate hydroxylase
MGASLWRVLPGAPGRRHGDPEQEPEPGPQSAVLVDDEGAFRDLRLARPAEEVLVVRPDRYLAAACRLAELPAALAVLGRALDLPGE